VLTRQVYIINSKPPKVHALELEEVTVEDLGGEDFAPHLNPPLLNTYPFPIVQVPPPRSDHADSIPLHWDTMDDTMLVYGSGALVTPISMIFTRGIFPLSVSSQTNCINHSTISDSTNNITSLVVGPTQAMSAVAFLPLTKNSLSYGMSSLDMLSTLVSSQPTCHVSSASSGGTSTPYQSFPWGGGHIPLSSPFIRIEDFSSSVPNSTWG